MDRVLVLDASYEDMRSAVKAVFGQFRLDVKGKRVLVKPNILGPYPREKHVTTHPSLVGAVVEYLVGEGADVVVGDNNGMRGYGMNEKCGRVSGIKDASGEKFKNIGKNSRKIKINSKNYVVSGEVLDCDLLVSLPKFKTHILTKITGGIKNSYGFLVGEEKARLHRTARSEEGFAESVVDVYETRIPDLTIMDAVVGMEGNGPNSTKLRHLGKLLASDNAVCLDAVMAQMMGFNPKEVDTLRIANKRGLGEIEVEKIDVVGTAEKIPNFRHPLNISYVKSLFPVYNTVVQAVMGMSRVEIDQEKCMVCRVCERHCPIEAIHEKDGRLYVDRKSCIKCYCCIELCPHNAVRVKGLADVIRRLVDSARGL